MSTGTKETCPVGPSQALQHPERFAQILIVPKETVLCKASGGRLSLLSLEAIGAWQPYRPHGSLSASETSSLGNSPVAQRGTYQNKSPGGFPLRSGYGRHCSGLA